MKDMATDYTPNSPSIMYKVTSRIELDTSGGKLINYDFAKFLVYLEVKGRLLLLLLLLGRNFKVHKEELVIYFLIFHLYVFL